MASSSVLDTTPGHLTPYLQLDRVLVDYGRTLQSALSDNFVGLYLSGSLAIGDFDLTSDVDFLVVTESEMASAEFGAVRAAHTQLLSQDTRWVKHLEYSFFPKPKLNDKSSPYDGHGRNQSEARLLWYFNNGASTMERSDHDNTLVTRWTLRYRSKAVLGPPPQTFAPEVTANELRREIKQSLLGWETLLIDDPAPFYNRFHQAFWVLNNCRVLQDLHEGRITSKLAGVNWARKHVDPEWKPLIDYCWQERQDTAIHISQPADPAVFERVVEFVRYTTRLAERYELPND